VLEAHATFDRDFRGDTIHPGILEILDEIGLADRLHERPHVKMYGPALPDMDGGSSAPTPIFDFRELLKTRFPYIMLMPQSEFLDFLAEEARTLPTFRLIMGASVHQLIEDNGSVSGVVYRMADQLHEIRAHLTVGADGRFSRVRKLAGFTPSPTSSPVELLWFRLPRLPGDPPGTGLIAPRFGAGHVLLTIDRADHWQVGLFFASGRYQELRAAGVEAMRRTIVAAQVLGPGLLVGLARTEDLEEVQRRREWPTRVIQALGAFGLWQLGRLLRSNRRPSVPRFARALMRT
jgi:2-polyprenyl-6-methoxyphenol hydroxylase-like FAD-dependent oxidoreductase